MSTWRQVATDTLPYCDPRFAQKCFPLVLNFYDSHVIIADILYANLSTKIGHALEL